MRETIRFVRKKGNRGRKDHYVPQDYLRGFIDPAREDLDKPLWIFDLKTKRLGGEKHDRSWLATWLLRLRQCGDRC